MPPNTPRPIVLAVGPFPPPTHGASVVTQAFVAKLIERTRTYVADISPRQRRGLLGHLTKAKRVAEALAKLARHSTRREPRILYMALDGGLGLAYNLLVAGAGRLFGYDIVVHYHAFSFVDRRSRLMAALAHVIGPSGRHIVLCEAMANGLRARYAPLGNCRMLELSGAAFVEPPPDTLREPGTPLRLGFLSNLMPEKGADTAVELLRQCLKEGLKVELRLAGPPYDKDLLAAIEKARQELGSRLDYLGPLYGSSKAEFLRSIDAFVFPTRYPTEARPQVVLEALSFGLPVLTIARGCIAEDVLPECGLCIPKDADFVAAALPVIRAWCEDDERLSLASHAALAQSRRLREHDLVRLENILAEVLDAGPAG